MDINYTEKKKDDFFDIFPLREENFSENGADEKNDYSDNIFTEKKVSDNENTLKNALNGNFLSNILKDKENTLIIILILVLLKNNADKKMIFALFYLLI